MDDTEMQKLQDRLAHIPGIMANFNPLREPDLSGFTEAYLRTAEPDPNSAGEIYHSLLNWIRAFEESLDKQYEVGIRLVNFGQTFQFHLQSITHCDSPMMRFGGVTEDGQPVDLIQHVNQISILLTRLPRKNANEPRSPIGFNAELKKPAAE